MQPEFKRLLFIPEYVLLSLDARGLDFNKFSSEVDKIVVDKTVNTEGVVLDLLRSKLSKYDVEDVIASNVIAKNHLGIEEVMIKNFIKYDRVITNLVDKNVNLREIIMSSATNASINVPFRFMGSETTVFVVLQNGFLNFITYNIVEFKTWFLNILINYLVKVCGEKELLSSNVFADFNKLVYRNTIV